MPAIIAPYYTLEDIDRAAVLSSGEGGETAVLRLLAQATTRDYASVCLPLTTDAWRARWHDMCVLSSVPGLGTDVGGPHVVRGTDGSDTGVGGINGAEERTRDQEQGTMSEEITGLRPDAGSNAAVVQKTNATRAEMWRTAPAFAREEVTVTRLDEASNVTVFASHWLELDAEDEWVRRDAELALQQELAYAAYLNIHTVVLPPPRSRAHVSSYARAVSAALARHPYIHIAIRIPIYHPAALRGSDSMAPSNSASSVQITLLPETVSGYASDEELNVSWDMWDTVRNVCDYNQRLCIVLDLTPPLPVVPGVLTRWLAEPVKYLYIPSSTFIGNAKGYPVLPKGTQTFIRDMMTLQPTVILAGSGSALHTKGGEAAYSQYVRHLEKTSPAMMAQQTSGTVENFAQGYQDYLQAPLQPLMDNLQSVTYQTFEQDPIKYRNYEEAMFRAIRDWDKDEEMVLCVAGAGRGPLVARALKAMERAKRRATIYAIEKNPNAYVTLQDRVQREWGSSVTLFYGDMRSVELPQKIDVLVSELLGSFGDNELSPECLDGAMRFMKPNGISIPSSYTAYLAPLSSSKLHQEARAQGGDKGVETPYVVMLQAVNLLSGDGAGVSGRCRGQVQPCWEFMHPRPDVVVDSRGLPMTNTHNVRSTSLTFHVPHAGVMHGMAGYFEAVLYPGVELSIHPHRKDISSKDMLSWFPLFFPLREPLYLPNNSEVTVSLWRLTNTRQVWYEWSAEAFLPVPRAELVPLAPSRRGSIAMRSPSPSLSLLSASASWSSALSPVVDAMDMPPSPPRISTSGDHDRPGATSMVKIGQTGLHNPGGRSSWIGL